MLLNGPAATVQDGQLDASLGAETGAGGGDDAGTADEEDSHNSILGHSNVVVRLAR